MAAKKKAKQPSAANIKKAAKQLKEMEGVMKKLTLSIKKHEKFMNDEFNYGNPEQGHK